MKKSCWNCELSEEVKYKEEGSLKARIKKSALFCIFAPPNHKCTDDFSWTSIIAGESKLRKYCRYPCVSETASCYQYQKVTTKRKIKRYEEKKADDAENKRMVEAKDKAWRLQEQEKRKKNREREEKERQGRNQERAERLRIKKRRASQKEYRKRKKAEKKEREAETLMLDSRFEILDL